jgi:CHAT domain-containing protein
LSSGDERTLAAAGANRWPYMLRDYAISYVPSAGVLASLQTRPEATPQARKTFLAFADPVYGDESRTEGSLVRSELRGAFGDEQSWKLARLVESRREVQQIASLYPKDKVSLLLGDQASEENVKTDGRFKEYRYIHFATHGLLNENNPPYSGLILSLTDSAATKAPASQTRGVSRSTSDSGGSSETTSARSASPQSEDGLLQVYEVFNLKLNADLVVLSACETGLGKEVKGEGLIGLTHAFFYAGTPSVMVSLWKVQDRSTADLMANFYQQLERASGKAEALRQAKLKLIQDKRYAHPYYWAPFVLIGDPR